MLKKRFLICLALLAALLVANLVMIQAASSSDLTFTLNSDGTGYVVSKCNTAATGTLSIPATYSGKPVVEIGREAFLDCTKLTSVTIPTSVKTIGWYAFSGCSGLTSISIPDNVTTLDWFAFADCTGLTSATIGNGVTCIDAAAFSGCTKLTTVTVGKAVTSIGWSAFKGCTQLSSINIPHTVTSVERYAFYGCEKLSSVTYCGTQEEWNAITKGEANTALTDATLQLHNFVDKVCTICQLYDGCTHATTNTATENSKAATCTKDGSYESVVYCSTCGEELSRTTVTVPATGHAPSSAVTENAVPATCTEDGSYESVVYCSTCGEEINRTTVPVPATGHNYVDGVCSICQDHKYIVGDIDGSNTVDHNDAIYLLLSIMFGEENYPLDNAPGDIDGNGIVNQDDAIYLLLYSMFGNDYYPINAQ